MKQNIQKIYALTPMQEGMLFHALNDDPSLYFTQISYTIHGDFVPDILNKSIAVLSERHDIFRTAFVSEKTQRPIQVVLKNREIAFSMEDISALNPAERTKYLDATLKENRSANFDLAKDALLRLKVIQLGAQTFRFIWSYHHIIMDGWCHGILIRELTAIYRALVSKVAIDLPPPVPFRNYVQWLEKQDLKKADQYWAKYLSGYKTRAQLPAYPADQVQHTSGVVATKRWELSKKKTKRLIDLAKQEKVTLNIIFQAIWGIVLARYTYAQDVVYGNVVSGRPTELEDADRMMGLFINTIPVRISFERHTSFADLLQKVHEDAIASLPYHHSALGRIKAKHKLVGDLIYHIVVFQNYLSEGKVDGTGLFDISDLKTFEHTNFDFYPEVRLGERMCVDLIYHPKRYTDDHAVEVLRKLDHLITQVLDDPKIPIGELEFAEKGIWQRRFLSGEKQSKKLRYWEEQLAGLTPLNFITDFPRTCREHYTFNTVIYPLDNFIRIPLELFCERSGHTPIVILSCIFQILLKRYTNQEAISIVTELSPDTQNQTNHPAGSSAKLVPLHTKVSGGLTFSELCAKTRSVFAIAKENLDALTDQTIDRMAIDQTAVRDALRARIQLLDPETDNETADPTTWYAPQLEDFCFTFLHDSQELVLKVSYQEELFSRLTIQRLAHHFHSLLRAALENPSTLVRDLSMLDENERQQLLFGFNNTDRAYPQHKTLIDWFEQQVAQTPERVAIVFGTEMYSYQDVNCRVNQLARYLLRKELPAEQLVGICLERSPLMVISMLAILKAGNAYVPIDPAYPQDRIRFVIEDANLPLILTHSNRTQLMESRSDATLLLLDTAWSMIGRESDANLSARPSASDLAYVIYTSGSTGNPKGVMIEHRSLVNFLVSMIGLLKINAASSFLAVTTYSFDISKLEIFSPLLVGGRMLLASATAATDPKQLRALFAKHCPTYMQATPATWRLLLEDGWKNESGLIVLSGGEAISEDLKDQLTALNTPEVWNLYGPTETTIWSTCKALKKTERVTIGKPIDNTQIYIIHTAEPSLSQHPLPVGAVGELCIGGDGLARGYLHRPGLTAERFIDNPFPERKGSKLYRTGDLARWLPDGNIECFGRLDDQVKVNGYRIELGEIETLLRQHPAIQQCVVAAKPDKQGYKRLFGYIIAHAPFKESDLRAYLQSRLPAYMIPSRIVELTDFPLTPNGKVDRKSLPYPDLSQQVKHPYVPAHNDLEAEFVCLWEEALNVEKVGVQDNFFDLGGDSIITIQVVSKARQLGYNLTNRDIFDFPTITSLAQFLTINRLQQTGDEQDMLQGAVNLTPIQHHLIAEAKDDVSSWSQTVLLKLDKRIPEQHMHEVYAALQEQHDALRFSYTREETGKTSQYYGLAKHKLTVVDWHTLPTGVSSDMIKELTRQASNDLAIYRGIVSQMTLIKMPDDDPANRLLITLHQLVADHASWRILLDDLAKGLHNLRQKGRIDLGAKHDSFREWAIHLSKLSKSDLILTQADFWYDLHQTYTPLPVERITDSRSTSVENTMVRFNRSLTTNLLTRANEAYHTEINDLIVSGLVLTICEWAACDSLVMGIRKNNRGPANQYLNINNTIGCFDHLFPVAFSLPRQMSESGLIKSVKEQLRNIPTHGVGFELLKYLTASESIRKRLAVVQWDITFTYLEPSTHFADSWSLFHPVGLTDSLIIHQRSTSVSGIAVCGAINDGKLTMHWSYSPREYHLETVNRLAKRCLQKLQQLVDHCLHQQKEGFTPSDYGLQGKVGLEELDQFLGSDELQGDDILKF